MAPLQHLPNGRDLGGIACDGGSVRHGLVFRSAAPTDPSAAAEIRSLGITASVDLRTALEREEQSAELPTSAAAIHADMLADASYAGASNLGQLAAQALRSHPVGTSLAERDLRRIMLESYRDFASLPSSRRSIGNVLTLEQDPGGIGTGEPSVDSSASGRTSPMTRTPCIAAEVLMSQIVA